MTQLALFKPEAAIPFQGNGAVFSPCRRYRYLLWRVWRPGDKLVAFIGLNPSTADETANDPTVRRCIGFAERWGYGGLVMLNLFAFRATDPKVMKAEPEPVGPENDQAIWNAAMAVDQVIAAWGTHGEHQGRDKRVRGQLQNLYCLGTTKDGHPRHPLYLPNDAERELLK